MAFQRIYNTKSNAKIFIRKLFNLQMIIKHYAGTEPSKGAIIRDEATKKGPH